MEDTIGLGQVGSLKLSFSKGMALAQVSVGVPVAALNVGLSVQIDAGVLIDELKAAIEKAAPSTVAIDEAVFGILKSAVVAIS